MGLTSSRDSFTISRDFFYMQCCAACIVGSAAVVVGARWGNPSQWRDEAISMGIIAFGVSTLFFFLGALFFQTKHENASFPRHREFFGGKKT
jgi:hypothetical protein